MAFIDVLPDERRATLTAFAALLGVTASHTMLETARDALFLAKIPVARLPLLYLAIAAAGLVIARIGATVEARRTPPKSTERRRVDPAMTSLLVASVATLAFWPGAAVPS